MPSIYSVPNESTSPRIAAAMRMGGFGCEIFYDDDYRAGGWAGFGSPANWNSLRQTIRYGEDWYYGDHAYFGRKRFFRITKNGFQHNGIGKPDFRRLRLFHQEAKPFKKTGSYVLLCLQSENYHARFGDSLPDYEHRIVKKIQQYSDRPIKIRSKSTDVPFEDHLRDAWAVVTLTSACALHALMEGIPAFTTGDSGVSSLTLRDPVNIERPFYPCAMQRFEVAAVLAANQWRLDEITNGTAWRQINETF